MQTISVIVPIFQVDKYLSTCLDSICNQTYRNLQIILIDDGSTDNSLSICEKYASIDNRIEVYHKDNGGLVSARKYGLEKAFGAYIAFVDGDDFINTNMYEELYKVINDSDADFICSGYNIVYLDKTSDLVFANEFSYHINNEEERAAFIEDSFFDVDKGRYIFPSIWSKLFKANFIKECYAHVPNEQNYGEDMICLYCCLAKFRRLISVKQGYYFYNVREGSLSNIYGLDYLKNEMSLYFTLFEVNEKLHNVMEPARFYFRMREKVKDMMVLSSDAHTKLGLIHYYFDNTNVIKGKRVIIYGAGAVGKSYLLQLCTENNCRVIGIVDRNNDQINWQGVQIFAPSDLSSLEFDYVILAFRTKQIADEVRRELIDMNVLDEKILWFEPQI